MATDRREIAERFANAVWQDEIARLMAEGKLPVLPDLIEIHIGYENLP